MSQLSDILGFESFHTKDLLNGIKKDPKRLILGVDPYSTKAWNKVLGKNDQPLVDQMGGAYGGHAISAFGNNEGGVYKRAQDAGIDTEAGAGMQDLAHAVSAIFAGQYGAGQLGGGASGGTKGGFGFGQPQKTPSFGGTGGFNPMAGGSDSLMNWQQFANMPMGGQPTQQSPQQNVQQQTEERRKREMLAKLLSQLRTA